MSWYVFASDGVHTVYVPIVSALCLAISSLFALYVRQNNRMQLALDMVTKSHRDCERQYTDARVKIAKLEADVRYLTMRLQESDEAAGRGSDERRGTGQPDGPAGG